MPVTRRTLGPSRRTMTAATTLALETLQLVTLTTRRRPSPAAHARAFRDAPRAPPAPPPDVARFPCSDDAGRSATNAVRRSSGPIPPPAAASQTAHRAAPRAPGHAMDPASSFLLRTPGSSLMIEERPQCTVRTMGTPEGASTFQMYISGTYWRAGQRRKRRRSMYRFGRSRMSVVSARISRSVSFIST